MASSFGPSLPQDADMNNAAIDDSTKMILFVIFIILFCGAKIYNFGLRKHKLLNFVMCEFVIMRNLIKFAAWIR